MQRTKLKKFITITFLILLGLATSSKVAGADFRFVAWGDTKDGYLALQSLSPKVVVQNPIFTIFAGDLELNGFTTTGMNVWKNAINGGVENGLFDKTLSVRGNHDISDLAGWQAYYDFPAVAVSVGATNFSAYSKDVTYSFDYENSHFVALDVPGDVSLMTAAQISWLDSDLAAASTRGLVHAFIWLHGPPYCVSSSHCAYSDLKGNAAPAGFWTTLNKYPFLTAIFAGHEHLQAHTVLESTRVPSLTRAVNQFVVGAAGAASVDPAPCDYPNRWSWCDNFDGYTVIDVSGDTVTVKFFAGLSAAPSQTFIIDTSGDVNGDGTVNVADALQALRFTAKLVSPTSAEIARGDVAPLIDGKPQPDGKIDIRDVVVILRKAVGLVTW